MKTKVVVFGPGPMFKGGIANYNTSLAKAFDKLGDIEVYIVSWTQQYPAIIPRDFIDKSSKVDQLAGTNIKIQYITNYNNPASWNATYKLIKEINPRMVIFQWSIAVQGLPLGYIANKITSNTNIEVVFDMHFVKQKEGSGIDSQFTKYGIKNAPTYVVHSFQTARELEELFPNTTFKTISTPEEFIKELPYSKQTASKTKTIIKLYHPIYDMFKEDPNFDVEAQKKKLNLKKHVFLFFGFIRKYKGLHNVIPAFAEVAKQRDDVSLLVVGESFWQTLDNTKLSTKIKKGIFGFAKKLFLKKQDDENDYRPLELITQLGLQDKTTVINEFVPNEAVHTYFQVSDSIVLYYLTATPSGVESISYNFKLPVLATKVGHFPETIKDGYNGYLAEPENIHAMAAAMIKSIEQPINRDNIEESSKDMSWENYAKAILRRK
jgi:glycosyltransferase involved in cell wall biosynthesis